MRGVGLLLAAQAAWIGAFVFTTLRDPIEAVLATAVLAIPLLFVAVGVYRLNPQARILGIAGSFLALGLGPFGVPIVALSLYALLPGSRKELFSGLFAEAREAVAGVAAAPSAGTPVLAFVLLVSLLVPMQLMPAGEGALLSDLNVTLVDLLGVGAINGLLCVISLGQGWMGRARVQFTLWAALGFCAYFYGPIGALWTFCLLIVLLFGVGVRQRFPTVVAIREQPVDMSAFPDRARFQRFLHEHGFTPLTELSTSFAMGTVAESISIRSDGMICRLALVAGGNTSVYTPYLETWFEDGRSIRSSNQVRWEDTNDSERHPLHQKVLGTYEELIAHHSRLTTGAGRALAVVHAADYVRLRRAAYDDCFRSAMRRGLVRVRDDSYRFTARGCAQIVWRTFDLVGALATERVW